MKKSILQYSVSAPNYMTLSLIYTLTGQTVDTETFIITKCMYLNIANIRSYTNQLIVTENYENVKRCVKKKQLNSLINM